MKKALVLLGLLMLAALVDEPRRDKDVVKVLEEAAKEIEVIIG